LADVVLVVWQGHWAEARSSTGILFVGIPVYLSVLINPRASAWLRDTVSGWRDSSLRRTSPSVVEVLTRLHIYRIIRSGDSMLRNQVLPEGLVALSSPNVAYVHPSIHGVGMSLRRWAFSSILEELSNLNISGHLRSRGSGMPLRRLVFPDILEELSNLNISGHTIRRRGGRLSRRRAIPGLLEGLSSLNISGHPTSRGGRLWLLRHYRSPSSLLCLRLLLAAKELSQETETGERTEFAHFAEVAEFVVVMLASQCWTCC
jgi:hypothetical protein